MGDKTHPWGVPVFKINSFDLTLFTQTVCGRSRKNALTQRTMLGLTSRSNLVHIVFMFSLQVSIEFIKSPNELKACRILQCTSSSHFILESSVHELDQMDCSLSDDPSYHRIHTSESDGDLEESWAAVNATQSMLPVEPVVDFRMTSLTLTVYRARTSSQNFITPPPPPTTSKARCS